MLQNHLPFVITHDSDQNLWTDMNKSDSINQIGGQSKVQNVRKDESEKSVDILDLQLKNVRDKLELLKVSKESLELHEKNDIIDQKIEKIEGQIEIEKNVEKELESLLDRNSKLKNIFSSDIVLPDLSEKEKGPINWDHVFRSTPHPTESITKNNFKDIWNSVVNLAKISGYSFNQLDAILKSVLRGNILDFYIGIEDLDVKQKFNILLQAYCPLNNFIT